MKLDDRILAGIPLLAPIPTAWMIGVSMDTVMGFPLPVAVAGALTVEGLGFVSINLANEMREFNRHLNGAELKQKLQAPVWQAYGVAGLYVVTATVMTVVLHIAPDMAVYAPLPFIVMTVAGGWLFALRKEHVERVEKWQEGRSARPKRRSASTSDAGATLSEPTSDAQREPATQERRSASQPAKIYRCACGNQYTDRYQYSGHTRSCAEHRSKAKLIPVGFRQDEKVQR